jgi:hypothetical protein
MMDVAVDRSIFRQSDPESRPLEPTGPHSWMARLGRTIVLRPFCYVAGIDYHLILLCPRTDRIWALQLGLQLIVSFSLIFAISYYSTGYVVSDPTMRTGVSAIIALTVFLFDRSLFQSDWFLQNGERKWLSRARIVVRVAISLCIAYILSLFLELAIFADTISDQLKRNHIAANASQFAEIEAFERQLEQRIAELQGRAAELEGAIASALDIRTQGPAASQLRELETEREKIGAEIAQYELRMNAEQFGQTPLPDNTGIIGRGPAYLFAVAQIAVLEGRLSEIDARIEALKKELLEKRPFLEEQLALTRTELAELTRSRDDQIGKRRIDVTSSPEFIALSGDPLARIAAYHQLFSDPERGTAIFQLSIMTKLFIIFLEIVPVLSKMFFSPLTAYGQIARSEVEQASSRAKANANRAVAAEQESAIDRSVRERAARESQSWADERAA